MAEHDAQEPPASEASSAAPLPAPPSSRPIVLVVGGAKGGVGKTLLASNLALYLATIGRRVVIVDADAEGANVHTFLGVPRPGGAESYHPPISTLRLDEALHEPQQAELPLDQPLPPAARAPIPPPARPSPSEPVELPIPGLRLLHLRRDELRRRGTRLLSGRRLLERLRALDAHFVVVDLGAGTTGPILDTFLGADISLFVTLPEPTAIENTYRFARAAFMRQLRTRLPEPGDRQRVEQALASAGGSLPPIDLVRQLEGRPSMPPPPPGSTALPAPSVGGVVRELLGEFRFRLVVNQARIRADLEIGDSLRSVARRRLGLCFDYLGYVDFDDTVWTCVRSRRPVLVESPGTKASRSMEKIARRVLAIASGKAAPPTFRNVPPESLHDLLEVDRGATDEEVRRAYKRAREIYAPDSLAVYGLFDAAGLETLQARLAEAYDVLLDPSRRRPYELSVFPIEPDADEGDAQEEERSEPLPAPPPITPETDFTGPLLRAVRESQGIDLRAVSERTKIGSAYLEALESDDFKSLPALVYVRGFVTEVAKFLRLDSEQVSRTYVRRYSRYLEERSR